MKNNFALFLIIGAVLLAGCISQPPSPPVSNVSNSSSGQQTGATTPPQPPGSTQPPGTIQPPAVKEFTVHGSSFKFTPNSITVNKGDTVKITFISDDSSHDICVEGYGCSSVVSGGGTSTLQFVAKDSGNLKFYCSVDGHRGFGMEGTLSVQ